MQLHMDRVRRLSELAIQRYPNAFSTDYEKNKKALDELAVITSKQLRNHIAGYITKLMREREQTKEAIVEEARAG